MANFWRGLSDPANGRRSNEAASGCLTVLARVLFGLLIWAPLTYWHGYVMVRLWDWFIMPLYPLVIPPLTVYAAIGLAFFFQSLGRRPDVSKAEGQYDAIVTAVLWPAVMLAGGWVWHYLQWGI